MVVDTPLAVYAPRQKKKDHQRKTSWYKIFRKNSSQEAFSCLIVSSKKAPWSCFVLICFHSPNDRRRLIDFFFFFLFPFSVVLYQDT